MTDQTTTTSADTGATTTGAATQQTTPPTDNAGTTALTGEGKTQQTEASTTALTDDGKAKEGTDNAKTEGAQDGKAKAEVPEKYEFTAPEGVALDDAAVAQFSEVAKELGMSQEAAQKLVDKMAPVIAGRTVEAVNNAQAEWKQQQQTDKEFGGDQLAANLGVARKAMEHFGSQELIALLNQSRLGDHPEIIRAFYRVGKAISEDTFVGGGATKSNTDPASVMFPTMTKSA